MNSKMSQKQVAEKLQLEGFDLTEKKSQKYQNSSTTANSNN